MQRQDFFSSIRFSRVLPICLLVVMLGGLLNPVAAVQSVSFGARTDFGTGSIPRSVAVGDFNGDGKLDLAVANQSSHSVSILLGLGAGSFGAKTDFGTGLTPFSVAVGDFDGDGKLDLAAANRDGDTVSILLGTGTGSFGAKTDFGTGTGPFAVAVGDLNGDGNLDLVVANFNSATVSILPGTGTGSFGAKTDFATGSFPASVAVSDLNGDGNLDLAVANFNSDTISILPGTGTGSFGAKADFGTGSGPTSVAVGDFNGDGMLDLAVANFNSATVSILLGTGTLSFGAKTDFGTGSTPVSVGVGDFNGDGKLDLAVANANSNTVSILPGTGTGGFEAKTDFATGLTPFSVAVGDFNGDGKLDLAVANQNSNTVSILLNTTPIVSAGVFCPRTDFGTGDNPYSVAVGDFNGDGKPDLALANETSNTVSILLGTGTGSFGAKTDFGTGSAPRSVAVGDFNGDGKLDLAVANDTSYLVSILLGTGTGSFGAKTDFGTGVRPNSVAVGDFNGDGKLDLAVANIVSNLVSILLGTGTGSFGAKTDFGTGSGPISVAVGDFNGDGKLDLAVANFGSSGNTVSILLGLGTGSFGAKTDFGTGSAPRLVAVGDFNGDGKLDLAVPNRDSHTVSILLGTGTGSFGAKTDFGTGSTPFSVAVGDFNGDGKLDLAVANGLGNTVSILPGLGTGSFGAKTDFGTGSIPLSVAAGDFNGDGKLDLAVANFSSATVSILLNNTPPNITAAPVTRTAGSPAANSRIATVDDAQNAPDTLSVTVNGGTSATVNSVTVTLNPGAPDASGEVFADVVAGCGATTATFTLRVTDGCGLFTEGTLTVMVNPNTPPVLSYATQMVDAGTMLMFNPATGPSDNDSVTSIVLQSVTPMTGLTLSVDNATGKVMVTSASLAGSYTVVIRASDNCAPGANAFTDASFTVNVGCPTITLSALPNGTGGFYDQTVTASPAGGDYTFTQTGGSLPPGLIFDGATGRLSGTPTTAGTYSFTLKATGIGTCMGTRAYTLAISCPTINLSPASLPNATANTPYSQTITTTPSGGSYIFTVTSGLLPAGLTLSSNGSFNGAPTQTGVFNFRVTASGSGGCAGFRDYVLVVDCPPITLTPASMPGGTIGMTYGQTVSGSPAGTYSYFVTSGALPTGLTLNASTGAMTGTPTTGGSFALTITASAGTCSGSKSYTIVIACPTISFTTTSPLPAGQAGVTYSQTLNVTPAGSYNFSLISGSLPGGLTLNPSTGVITGRPTVTGPYTFTIKAQNATGCNATQAFSLTISCPAMTLSPASLPAGTTGTAYRQTIVASPAGGNYSYAVTSGSLPAGLNLNFATGVLSGTPATNGTSTFTITATGFGGCTGSQAYTVMIGGGGCPVITLPASLPNGNVGQLYTKSVAASPAASYTYLVTGTLPPGLTLYASIGLIFGYPTTAGSYNFTVTASNTNNCTGSQSYSVQIGAASQGR